MAIVDIEMCINLINSERTSNKDIEDQIIRIDKMLHSGNFNRDDDRVILYCLKDDLLQKLEKRNQEYPRLSG